MHINLIKDGKLLTYKLPNVVSGNVWLTEIDSNGIEKNIVSIEANTIEIDSKRMNLAKLNWPFTNDNTIDIIRNSGMHMIGGFVNVDIALAIFNLSIILP